MKISHISFFWLLCCLLWQCKTNKPTIRIDDQRDMCYLIDTLLQDRSVQEMLDLVNLDSYDNCVRVTDKDHILPCTYNGFYRFNNNIAVVKTDNLNYSFNTGRCREIVVSHKSDIEDSLFSITFFIYEYGCKEIRTDIYGVTFFIQVKNGGSAIKSKSYGDIDL
jgi:hypothetical protein